MYERCNATSRSFLSSAGMPGFVPTAKNNE